MVMICAHRRCLISALKLATAAWWIPFLVARSSFSSATVRSLRLSLSPRPKFRACKNRNITTLCIFY